MIACLRGKLLSKRPDNVIIDVGGVGYIVSVPFSTLSSLPEESHDVFIYTYTHVREDILQLFGFRSEEEKRIFMTLIGVTGIGPKIALSILSTIPADTFYGLVHSEDVESLCRVPGLGKKTAQRIILELREKLPALKEKKDMIYEDTLSALVNLGYKRNIAQDALDKAYGSGLKDIESLLRESLKYLTKE